MSIIILRLIHILCSTFWVGAGLMNVFFLAPTVKKTGPAGGEFMRTLMQQTRFSLVMDVASTLTILSGAWLYWLISGGLQMTWITTANGMALTIGGVAAIVAYALAYTFVRPAATRMGMLGQEMQGAGGPPKPEQLAQMGALQKKMGMGGLAVAMLLLLSVAGMAWFR